jgi:hypothetical protein
MAAMIATCDDAMLFAASANFGKMRLIRVYSSKAKSSTETIYIT